MNRTYLTLVIAIALGAGIISYAGYQYVQMKAAPEMATSTIEAMQAPAQHPYGAVTLRVGEAARFESVTIRPLRVVEDSRCPENARCIHAGFIKVEVEVISGMGTSTGTLSFEDGMTTEAESIRLVGASPENQAGETIAQEDYRLTFEVLKRISQEPAPAPTEPAPSGGCYVGGCSMHICSDRPDIVSTCEYREQYACYKTATCERQASGECGWTETAELKACLAGTR